MESETLLYVVRILDGPDMYIPAGQVKASVQRCPGGYIHRYEHAGGAVWQCVMTLQSGLRTVRFADLHPQPLEASPPDSPEVTQLWPE